MLTLLTPSTTETGAVQITHPRWGPRLATPTSGARLKRRLDTLIFTLDDVLSKGDLGTPITSRPDPWASGSTVLRADRSQLDHRPTPHVGQVAATIQAELAISGVDLAKLLDVARNTVAAWSQGRGTYPKTTRRLYEVAAALDMARAGQPLRLAHWWRSPGPDGVTWSEVLMAADGPARVGAAYRDRIFTRPQPRLLADIDEQYEDLTTTHLPSPGRVETKPRRRPR